MFSAEKLQRMKRPKCDVRLRDLLVFKCFHVCLVYIIRWIHGLFQL